MNIEIICEEIEDEQDEFICKNKKHKFNQCCQECSDVSRCKYHCDYAHGHDCLAKKEIEV